MKNDLSVAVGSELPVAELRAEIQVIVNLAVEDDPYGAIGIGHRLVTACEIDDAQTCHPKGKAARRILVLAAIIRPAVDQPIAHRTYQGRGRLL